MSQKSKLNRARREAQQEKQAKKVVEIIFWSLILLAVIYTIWVVVA